MVEWDLRRLRMLRELDERGTLASVAAALGYSPSAVSQQLAVLEREAGTRLLERAGRGVRLTDAGRVLAQHALTLLAGAEAARADLAALADDVRGTVRAGGLQSATRHLLIPTLAQLRRQHPGVRLEVAELEFEQAVPELRLGSLDLVISDEYATRPRPQRSGIRREVLLSEELLVVLPAAHACARSGAAVDIADLRDDVWVSSASGTGHHDLVIATCRASGGFEPDLRHRSNDADVQFEIVRSGGAVALMPRLTVPVADPALAVRPVRGAAVERRLLLLTRDQSAAPALEVVLAATRGRGRSLGG